MIRHVLLGVPVHLQGEEDALCQRMGDSGRASTYHFGRQIDQWDALLQDVQALAHHVVQAPDGGLEELHRRLDGVVGRRDRGFGGLEVPGEEPVVVLDLAVDVLHSLHAGLH